jgi:hypothetical protein
MRFALCLLLVATWTVPAKSQSSAPTKGSNTYSGKAEKAHPSTPVVEPQRSISPQASEKYPKRETGDPADPAHSWIDMVNAISTGVIALFTICAAIFILRQVRVTRSVERAWMVGTPRFKKFEGPPEPGQGLLYVCELKNTGRTPARILETALTIRKADSFALIPPEPSYMGTERISFNETIIAPKGSFIITAASGNFTQGQYVALRNLKLILYAYGYIKYLDTFGRPHETRFCHYYRIPGVWEPQFEGFQLCIQAPQAYNRAT